MRPNVCSYGRAREKSLFLVHEWRWAAWRYSVLSFELWPREQSENETSYCKLRSAHFAFAFHILWRKENTWVFRHYHERLEGVCSVHTSSYSERRTFSVLILVFFFFSSTFPLTPSPMHHRTHTHETQVANLNISSFLFIPKNNVRVLFWHYFSSSPPPYLGADWEKRWTHTHTRERRWCFQQYWNILRVV